jgi:hypothetical protein
VSDGFLVLASPLLTLATPADDIESIRSNTPKILAMLASVGQPDGRVDKAMHDQFWSLFPDSVRNDPSFFQSLDMVKSMTFQKELWESIRLSARAKKVVRTLSYESARDRAYLGNPTGKELSILADQMLDAAASGKPYRGQSFNGRITEEQANQVLDGLNATLARLQVLLNPVWQGR